MDAEIQVREPQSDARDEHDLLWSFRRRGRVVLTGLPGGGKSTALAATVSEWARRDDWAVPIAVSLRRLGEKGRFRKRPLRDNILDIAVEPLQSEDRPLVRESLELALSTGQAALFLDGLDEAADRSLLLTSDIAKMLGEVHPDTDVLLATRDVAYAHAEILGFQDLRLGSPRNWRKAVVTILRAVAWQRKESEPEEWVSSRVEWIERTLSLDSQLGETPLMPVLLAILATDQTVDMLPRTRSLILRQVIEDVVRRRESEREILVSGIPAGHEGAALIGTFPHIAAAVADAGGAALQAHVVDLLSGYLQNDWGLASASAHATALQVVRFWDESGMFVASGNSKMVAPRLRLFLEIGTALHAASRPDEADTWVTRTAESPNSRETLILAAGLSEAIAEALINRACGGHSESDNVLAVAAAEALGQGGRASSDSIRRLTERLLPLLGPGDVEAWRVLRTLVRIAVPDDLQAAVLSGIQRSFSAAHFLIARCLASLEWKWSADRRNSLLEEALLLSELPRLARRQPRKSPYLTAKDILTDPAFMQVKERAASILLPSRPDLAPMIAQSIEHCSSRTAEALAAILRRNGHTGLAHAKHEGRLAAFLSTAPLAQSFSQMHQDLWETLDSLSNVSTPAVLTLSEERRMQELASLVETLNLNDVSASMAGERWSKLRGQWTALVSRLGGFDAAVIAAQAAILKREIGRDGTVGYRQFFSLFEVGKRAELDRWDRVSDVEAGRQVLLAVLDSPRGSAVVAALAIATHPDRPQTAKLLQESFAALPNESKTPAVWAYLNLVDDVVTEAMHLAASSDEHVRRAVAQSTLVVSGGQLTPVGSILAHDRCRQVQLAVLQRIKDELPKQPGLELLALLEGLAASKDAPFTCYWCGAINEAAVAFCASCHSGTEKPSAEANELLGRLRAPTASGEEECQPAPPA